VMSTQDVTPCSPSVAGALSLHRGRHTSGTLNSGDENADEIADARRNGRCFPCRCSCNAVLWAHVCDQASHPIARIRRAVARV
jgi:hypothetical protein